MKQNLGYSLLNSEKTTKALPFQIQTCREVFEKQEDGYCAAHSNNHFEIIWITNGPGTNYIDLQKSEIKNNQLFCIKPGQIHRIDEAHILEGYVISFTEVFFNMEDQNSMYHTSLFQLFANSNGILISNDIDDMKYIAERMMQEFESFNPFRTEILKR